MVTRQKQPSHIFHHTAVGNIFGNTGGRVVMLVMTACGNFTFNWILTVKASLFSLLGEFKVNSVN